MSVNYQAPEELLSRKLKPPLSSKALDKSSTLYPVVIFPYFIQQAKGFHQSHQFEMRAFGKKIEITPHAEKPPSGYNGSDSAARATCTVCIFTGRDYAPLCSYHSCRNWYISSTTQNLGKPKATQGSPHTFPCSDHPVIEDQLIAYRGQAAMVIVVPLTISYPKIGLEWHKELTQTHVAVQDFDKAIPSFHFTDGDNLLQPEIGTVQTTELFKQDVSLTAPTTSATSTPTPKSQLFQDQGEIFDPGRIHARKSGPTAA